MAAYFELQPAAGLLHLLFQVGDEVGLLLLGEGLGLLALLALAVGGVGDLNEVPDGLDNGLGDDAVGLV